jgi:membrane-associated phospholipid phosphatase
VAKRIANLISIIFNPFLTGLVLILLVSFKTTASIFDAIKWSLLLTLLTILPVFLFTVYQFRRKKVDSIFANVRQQRTKIYALAVLLAGASAVLLFLVKAPLILLALLIAAFSANVIFMLLNLWWKISLHTAFIAAAVTVLVFIFGSVAMPTIVLIPLVAWARIKLEHHVPAQVIGAALMSPSILLLVFYLFGLIRL